MAGNIDRRLAVLERGNGTLNIGDLLDAAEDKRIDYSDPQTWPASWAGKTIDPALLRTLDALDPGFTRPETRDVRERLADLPL